MSSPQSFQDGVANCAVGMCARQDSSRLCWQIQGRGRLTGASCFDWVGMPRCAGDYPLAVIVSQILRTPKQVQLPPLSCLSVRICIRSHCLHARRQGARTYTHTVALLSLLSHSPSLSHFFSPSLFLSLPLSPPSQMFPTHRDTHLPRSCLHSRSAYAL
jgi:hypothetical protein